MKYETYKDLKNNGIDVVSSQPTDKTMEEAKKFWGVTEQAKEELSCKNCDYCGDEEECSSPYPLDYNPDKTCANHSRLKSTILDVVNHPSHYNKDGIECIQAIKASMGDDEYQGYLKGNTLKYLWRYRYKENPVQDLGKAQWYLNRLIDSVKKEKEDV